jgi:predicted sulfurtransferase
MEKEMSFTTEAPSKRSRSKDPKDAKKKKKRHKSEHESSDAVSSIPELQSTQQQQPGRQGAKFNTATFNAEQNRPPPPTEQEIQDCYVPTPIPSWKEIKERHEKCPSVGKWFPKAVILKSSVHYTNAEIRLLQRQQQEESGANNISAKKVTIPTASLLLFYQYVHPVVWPQFRVDLLMAYLIQIAERRTNLGGRIRVAPEGVNVTVSAVGINTSSSAMTLRHFVWDLVRFDPAVFANTDFKYIDHIQADRHFKDLKIFPVQELVFYGFKTTAAKTGNDNDEPPKDPAPLEKTGVHLNPAEFHEMLSHDASTTVVIDVRNHYEAALGRFDGQEQKCGTKPGNANNKTTTATRSGGAEYIDPKMRKSTDFARWLSKPETIEKLQDKNVLLFCTGGVRCERASAFVNATLGSYSSQKNSTAVVRGVYQLQGGVERYLQEYPDGGYWRGKNFVFDKREAFAAGDLDGDGGVVEGHKKKKKSIASGSDDSGIKTKCCLCDKPWDRYLGKKKCSTCGVPVLMCDSCMSTNKETNQQESTVLARRCPLCVEENVTVRVEETEWTNNGADSFVAPRQQSTSGKRGAPRDNTSQSSKAAPSVLKWGGGHAANKKERRRFQNTPCRFGADCRRKDCFFSHATRNAESK